jgi:large subunit ribosomal protein L2
MPIKIIKPTSNARRNMSIFVGEKNKTSKKSLLIAKTRSSGRNNEGKITVRRRGGGSKKMIRNVDFRLEQSDAHIFSVVGIEYDPLRNASLALLKSNDGVFKYIISTDKMKIGSKVESAESATFKSGNRMMIKNIPPSTQIHSIELKRGGGGVLARSAGSYATLMGFEQDNAIVKLASGEIRKVKSELYASVGVVSNTEFSKQVIGKAGRMRRFGGRPRVRGKAMNPCDHPHGGGEGNTSIGLKRPKTPWGMPALGRKTRRSKKYSNSMILKGNR